MTRGVVGWVLALWMSLSSAWAGAEFVMSGHPIRVLGGLALLAGSVVWFLVSREQLGHS